MSSGPYSAFSTKVTPQDQPIPTQLDRQVENNAGGFVYTLGDMKALERFLILGSEGGTYYVTEPTLTKENALRTIKAIQGNGKEAVDLIVTISHEGRALKNDPAIFALALAAATPDPKVRAYALANLHRVCRIPTHLFHFVTYVEKLRGWGPTLRKAIASWYQDQDVDRLAYALVKYQARDGWSHRDLLRLSHPKSKGDRSRHALYRWALKVDQGERAVPNKDKSVIRTYPATTGVLPRIVQGFERAKEGEDIITLIKEYNLPREALPTSSLNDPKVWEALLKGMPLGALLRNLGKMSAVGLLKPFSDASNLVCERLHNEGLIREARLHPIAILIAQKVYSRGMGIKGSLTWDTDPKITDALNDAFYLAFRSITPLKKRFLIGVDVSGSMSSPCGGSPLSCAEGAAAMAMAISRVEPACYVHGFTAGSSGSRGYQYYGRDQGKSLEGFVDLGITPSMRLDDVLKRTSELNFGATDCAVPMLYALKKDLKVDCFIVITDNETWAGTIHPSQALKKYREATGIQASEVVIGMAATNFTIADPLDPLTLDVAGFDASVPQVIQEFLKG